MVKFRVLSRIAAGVVLVVAVVAGASAASAEVAGIDWTSRTSAADNDWYSVTYGNGLFVVVANSGTGNRVMTSRSTTTQWTVINQGAPMPATGLCEGIDDTEFAYGTGVSGGWVRGWEPWVNTTIGADGQRKGGWACIRQLVNTGGDVWRIQS